MVLYENRDAAQIGGPKGSAKKLEAEDMLKIYQMAAGK